MADTLVQVQEVLRRVFDDDDLVVSRSTTAGDVDGWDSMMHINVIIAVEKKFGIKFAAAETNALKEVGQDLGIFCDVVERKLAAKK